MNRFTINDRMVILRDLLHEGPSQANWEDLCSLFYGWPDDETLEVGLDYAVHHLATWPADLCKVEHDFGSLLCSKENMDDPRLLLLRKLELSGGSEDMKIVHFKNLKNVQELFLLDWCDSKDATSLAHSDAFPALRILDVGFDLRAISTHYTDYEMMLQGSLPDKENFLQFVQSPLFHQLKEVSMTVGLTDEMLRLFVQSGPFRNLRVLKSIRPVGEFNEEWARIWVEQPAFPALEKLGIRTNPANDRVVQIFRESPHFPDSVKECIKLSPFQ